MIHLESVEAITKVSETGNDVAAKSVRYVMEWTFQRVTYFFSSRPSSTNAVTTRSLGKRFAKTAAPSGEAIRLRKRMRSSGTPLLRSTSTAMRAEPPVKCQSPATIPLYSVSTYQ
jgi:hypothetical protein